MKRRLVVGLIGLLLFSMLPDKGFAQRPVQAVAGPQPVLQAGLAGEEVRGAREQQRGQTGQRGQAEIPVLRLVTGDVDPAQLPDPYASSTSDEPHLYVAQFRDVITDRSYAVLNGAGAEVGSYLPDFAFVVRMSAQQAQQVRKSDLVRAVTPFLPEWKLSPALAAAGEEVDVHVTTLPGSRPGARLRELSGARKVSASEGGLRLHGIARKNAARLAEDDDVLFVDVVHPLKLANDVARGIMQVDGQPTSPWVTGLTGENQVVAVADTGLDTGDLATLHPDFADRVLATYALSDRGSWSDPHGHGTHVAGSVLGSGAASGGAFAGVAPGARLVLQSVMDSNGYMSGIPYDLGLLFEQARSAGAKIHTNSWSSDAGGAYTYDSQNVDAYTWSHKDFTVLFAAGNAGLNRDGTTAYFSVGSPATAKNAIAVGASENLRPFDSWGDNANDVAQFSSRGWTADYRTKPDVVAPGTWILSTRSALASDSTYWDTYDSRYAYMGGTSMATPLTAGATALVREGLQKKGFRNPSSALIKATLINGAQAMGDGWMSRDYGWGRVDLVQSLNPGGERLNAYRDVTAGLTTGGLQTYSYPLSAGEILKITLVWSDYPGSPAASRQLVNDLDLIVVGPDGKQYIGNCWTDGRTTSGPNCPYTTYRDNIDNVENVYIQAPVAGTYSVKVKGYNVPRGPQPYALVVSGRLADTTAPTVRITAPAAGALVSGSVEVRATASDNLGLSHVEFYQGATLLETVYTPNESGFYATTLDTTLLANGPNTITAKAYDLKLNMASNSISLVVDNQDPTLTLTAPLNGALVRGTVNVTATAADSAGITKVVFGLDEEPTYTDTYAPYAWSWNTTTVPDGQHFVHALAYDKAGNTTPSTVEVTVDNTPPSLEFVAPAAGSFLPAGETLLAAIASDTNGVTRVDFYAGTTLIGTDTTGDDDYTATWDTSKLLSGAYTLKAVAVDRAGNSRTVTRSVTVDSAAPALTITTPVANAAVAGTVLVKGTVSDNKRVGNVKIYVDDVLQTTLTPATAVTSYPYQWTWETAGNGPRVLKVVAEDSAGNKMERAITVNVDNTDPVVAITSPTTGGYAGISNTVTVDASDNVGIARVEFFRNGVKVGYDTTAPYTWSFSTASLPNGSTQVLTAVAYDLVGRTATSAPVTVTVDNLAPQTLAIAMDPNPGTLPFGGSTTVTAAVGADEGVTRVLFYVDTTLVATDTEAPYAFAWDTTAATNGSHKVTAVAYDQAGNSKSVYTTVTVDNEAPAYTLTGMAEGKQISANTTVGIAARDNARLKQLLVYLDGNESAPLKNQALTTATYTTSLVVPGDSLADGDHTLQIRLTDAAGNVKADTITFKVDNTAPTVALTDPAQGAKIGLGPVTLTASADDANGIARVDFFAGSTKIGSDSSSDGGWTVTWNVTSTTYSNTYLLKAVAYDNAGNAATASYSVVVDSVLPTVSVTKPAANAVVKGDAVALAASAQDAKGIQKFEVLVDGALHESVTPAGMPASYAYTGTWDTTGLEAGPHTLTFRATDAYGNVNAKTVSVKVDNASPAVSITAPVDGGYVKASNVVTANLTDAGAGIKKVEVLVNGVVKYTYTLYTPAATYTLRWTWYTTGLAQGTPHTLAVRATDAAGNVTTDNVSVQVDTTAPTATLQTPAAGLVRGTVAVTVDAADSIGLERAEIFLGSTKIATLSGSGTAQTFLYNWDTTTSANAAYTLKVVVYDLAGNSVAKSVSVKVDNLAPTVRISSPASGATVKGTITVTATTSDLNGIAKVEFYLDGELQATDSVYAYSWAWNTTTATPGSHTISVRSYDKAGNMSSSSVTVTVSNP